MTAPLVNRDRGTDRHRDRDRDSHRDRDSDQDRDQDRDWVPDRDRDRNGIGTGTGTGTGTRTGMGMGTTVPANSRLWVRPPLAPVSPLLGFVGPLACPMHCPACRRPIFSCPVPSRSRRGKCKIITGVVVANLTGAH